MRKESALAYADRHATLMDASPADSSHDRETHNININNEFEIIATVNIMLPTRGQMISIARKRKMSGD